MPNTFVLSDSSINDFGTRVITSGIKLERFNKNPIGLWMHKRDDGWSISETPLPILRWENIRVDGDQLLADPVFDENDQFALTIKQKVDNGFIKMASIGIDIIAVSSDPKVMLPGQTRPAITECELIEASIVDIGSNASALKLYKPAKEKVMRCSYSDFQDQLPEMAPINKNLNMKKFLLTKLAILAVFLGFKPEDEVDITQEHLEKVDAEMKLRADNITTLTAERDQARTELAAAKTAKETAEASLATANTSIATLTTENGTLKTENAALKVQAGAPPATVVKENENGDAGDGKDADAEYCASHTMAENVAYLRSKRHPKTS